MRRFTLLTLTAVGAALLCPLRARAQQDPAQFYQSQMADLYRALNDPSVNSRVRNIWFDLVRYTGRMFPVVPAQQFTAGQALPNGVVLLDLSIAANPRREVTAFFLAHEYGHEMMGHPQLTITPIGQMLAAMGGTMQEDAADRWAARFLRQDGIDVAPVIAFLCGIPGGGEGDTHSDGPTRARNVARAYGASSDDVCEGAADPDGSDDDADRPTYDVRLRMWSVSEGSPVAMELLVDGESVGEMNNVNGPLALSAGALAEGMHSFTITNITMFNQFGQVVASGLECSGRFSVRASGTFLIAARLLPNGEVRCQVQR